MRKDIVRFCNNCSINVSANVSQCPSCHSDSSLSYFEGMYYDKFDLYSYNKVNGEAANIKIMFETERKDFIEPLLDKSDSEGNYEGFIVRRPGSGKIVYMTPLETVREAPTPKSGCLVFLVAVSLGGWALSLLIF